MQVTAKDREAIREIAKKYREIAENPVMKERKRLWTASHDLKSERPMFLFEPFWLDGFLDGYEFKCEHPLLRNVEERMIFDIKQYEELGDDIVLEPYFRICWFDPKNLVVNPSDYGEIKVQQREAKGDSIAFLSDFPIKTPDDVKKLRHRELTFDPEPSLKMKAFLEEMIGDILPIRLENYDNFFHNQGNHPFVGNMFIGLTRDVFELIGAENMMFWMFDEPDALHELCRFLTDEKMAFFEFLRKEKILAANANNQFCAPSTYGYISELPNLSDEPLDNFKDMWIQAESQETQMFSPSQFAEFFLPYLAEISNEFGLTYYGCCETVNDRFDLITGAIKNVRCMSVSAWSDPYQCAELFGKNVVYSKKPCPAYVSSAVPQWDAVKKEAEQVAEATKANGCNVDVIFRDAYSRICTPKVAAEWIAMWKKIMGV